jgi:hypothetical protein
MKVSQLLVFSLGTTVLAVAQGLPPGLPPELALPGAQTPTAQTPAAEAPPPASVPAVPKVPVPAPSLDVPIPEKIPVEHYQTLWQRSPFELSIQTANAAPTGIAADWLLTSLSRIDGQPVAILVNRTSSETVVVKTKDNGLHGMRIASAQIASDFRQSKVKIVRGNEEAELIFQEQDLASMAALAPVTPPPSSNPAAAANLPGQPTPNPSVRPGTNATPSVPRRPNRIIVRPKPVTPPPNL